MTNSTQYAHAAMAIDLGVEFMKLALIKPGVPMEIVLNRESHRKTAFALTIKQGERFFGSEALKKGVAATKNTYTFFLDLVGKQFFDPSVQNYQKRFPYLQLKQNDQRGTVNFVTDAGEIPVETMLAMVLANARSEVDAYAGQPVRDAVISVPAYFGPAERRAIEDAAQIAGLNLLQLLSAGASAALNYGIFRYKDITGQPQTLLIYDVGSTKTQATVVQYILANDDDKGEVPKLEVIGTGSDPQLGGHHLTLKLRDQLVNAFRKQHPKTDGDIVNSPQAMAKLLREADRVKQVLSANAETFAQVECLFQDLDFRAKCTRQELEELLMEFEPRLLEPIKSALQMARIGVEKLERILLMGAATRVPRLQEVLARFFNGEELSRNLNTDEAIALGAIYQAARESKNFIVKRFDVVDTNVAGQKGQLKRMDEKEIAEAKALLFQFESREKTKAERDHALNSLESAVFDYSSRMEEEEFSKFGTKAELELIAKMLTDLKEWLEDVPEGASVEQLKEKRRELVKPIRKLKSRKQQKEERPEYIRKLTKAVEEAEKQLPAFKNATELFTEPELESFSQLIAGTKAWFDSTKRQLEELADNQDAAVTTDDLKAKSLALNKELKLLSNKLKSAPKPKEDAKRKAEEHGNAPAEDDGKKTAGDVDMKGEEGGGGDGKRENGQQKEGAKQGAGPMELD